MKHILNYGIFFNLYQNLIGSNRWLKRYYNNYILPELNKYENLKEVYLLDIGCGTGNLIPNLPNDINYLGLDYSENYINYATKKFKKRNFLRRNAKENFEDEHKYNIIVCEALISNLDDNEAGVLFNSIINCANKQNCKIILSDLNYSDDCTKTEKFLLKHERGSVIRNKKEYDKLISKYFDITNITEIHNAYRIPYSKIVIECRLKN